MRLLANVFQKLGFPGLLAVLVAVIIVLSIAWASLNFVVNEVLLDNPNVDENYLPEITYTDEGDQEGEVFTDSGVIITDREYSVLDVMPYSSPNFSVFYIEGPGQFYVDIDPSSGTTKEEVYLWFESFPGITNARDEVDIVWLSDQPKAGAPAE